MSLLSDAARLIVATGRLSLACHVGPDGDALGSMLGLARAAADAGKTVVAVSALLTAEADIADILGRNRISLASIIQHEAPEVDEAAVPAGNGLPVVPVVVMTHRTSEGNFRRAEGELERLTTLRPPWVRMPVAD